MLDTNVTSQGMSDTAKNTNIIFLNRVSPIGNAEGSLNVCKCIRLAINTGETNYMEVVLIDSLHNARTCSTYLSF